jgi:hypothetical protein
VHFLMDRGERKGKIGIRRLDRCLKLDAFEKLENEVGGMRMKRLSFRGAV